MANPTSEFLGGMYCCHWVTLTFLFPVNAGNWVWFLLINLFCCISLKQALVSAGHVEGSCVAVLFHSLVQSCAVVSLGFAYLRTLCQNRMSIELGPGTKAIELYLNNNLVKWMQHLNFSYLVLMSSFRVAFWAVILNLWLCSCPLPS